jgi:predicted DNA-binding ribbon-helix-helix protein
MLIKRSFRLAGHATSVALEPEFWAVLEQMAAARQTSLSALVAEVDKGREGRNLASTLRVYVLACAKSV